MADASHWADFGKRWGAGRTFVAASLRLARPFLHVAGVWVRELHPTSPCRHDHLAVRLASRAEMRHAATISELPIDAPFVNAAFSRGDICCGAFDGERLIAYGFRTVLGSAPHLDGLLARFDQKFCYGYNAFTHPDFRGRHLAFTMTNFLDLHSAALGCTHQVSFVEAANFPAIQATRRRGARRIGWACYARAFGRHVPFQVPSRNRAAFRFSVR